MTIALHLDPRRTEMRPLCDAPRPGRTLTGPQETVTPRSYAVPARSRYRPCRVARRGTYARDRRPDVAGGCAAARNRRGTARLVQRMHRTGTRCLHPGAPPCPSARRIGWRPPLCVSRSLRTIGDRPIARPSCAGHRSARAMIGAVVNPIPWPATELGRAMTPGVPPSLPGSFAASVHRGAPYPDIRHFMTTPRIRN